MSGSAAPLLLLDNRKKDMNEDDDEEKEKEKIKNAIAYKRYINGDK